MLAGSFASDDATCGTFVSLALISPARRGCSATGTRGKQLIAKLGLDRSTALTRHGPSVWLRANWLYHWAVVALTRRPRHEVFPGSGASAEVGEVAASDFRSFGRQCTRTHG